MSIPLPSRFNPVIMPYFFTRRKRIAAHPEPIPAGNYYISVNYFIIPADSIIDVSGGGSA
jgi:hypothetical protein